MPVVSFLLIYDSIGHFLKIYHVYTEVQKLFLVKERYCNFEVKFCLTSFCVQTVAQQQMIKQSRKNWWKKQAHITQHKKWSFPLRISLVNKTFTVISWSVLKIEGLELIFRYIMYYIQQVIWNVSCFLLARISVWSKLLPYIRDYCLKTSVSNWVAGFFMMS